MSSEQADDVSYFEKNEIDQLHHAVLAISKQCFDLKKMCITVIIAIFAIIPHIQGDHHNYKNLYYCISILAPLFFYIADTYCYYYQKKLRSRMALIIKNAKHKASIEYYPCKVCVNNATILGAMFNSSQWFYFILIIILIGASLFLNYIESI